MLHSQTISNHVKQVVFDSLQFQFNIHECFICLSQSTSTFLLGNVAIIQNFPTCHQDLSMESSSNKGGVDLHTLVDRARKRSRERG